MPRKILISFLGTNNYVPCNYYTEGDDTQKVSNVRYIQEAIIDLYCQDFDGPDDGFHFFLTDDAKVRNWEDNDQYNFNSKENDLKNKGLKSVLKDLNLFDRVKTHSIKEGYSTDDIWKIFEKVFDVIQEGDEIILDITHGFRSLPMLAMVLSNYAKTLKNADLKMVLYGAFEKLGPAFNVREMPKAERNAPILNLTALSDIQDWTSATKNFIKNGISTDLESVIDKSRNIAPNDSEFLDALSKLKKNLKLFTSNLKVNRGKEILDGNYYLAIQEAIGVLNQKKFTYPPLNKILTRINEKVSDFLKNKDVNWLHAVEWCIEKGLTQQAITQLQEGVVSQICKLLDLDPNDYLERGVAKSALYKHNGVISLAPEVETKYKDNKGHPDRIAYITKVGKGLQMPFVIEVANPYNNLTNVLRNDINHGGYIVKYSYDDGVKKITKNPKKASDIDNKLKRYYEQIKLAAQNHNII